MANPKLSNTLAHDAKLVLSFITLKKYQDLKKSDGLMIFVHLREFCYSFDQSKKGRKLKLSAGTNTLVS